MCLQIFVVLDAFGVLVVSSSFRVWCIFGGVFNFSCLVPFWCVGVVSSSFVVFDAFLLVCLQVFVVPFGGVRVSSSFVALGAFWCVSVGVSSSFRRVWCLLVCWCGVWVFKFSSCWMPFGVGVVSSSFRRVGCLLVCWCGVFKFSSWCWWGANFRCVRAFWCVGVVSSSFHRVWCLLMHEGFHDPKLGGRILHEANMWVAESFMKASDSAQLN